MATKIEGHVRTHLLKESPEFVESALWTKHKCGGDGYDTPATLIIGGKGFTESDVNDRDAKTRAVVQALCDALKVERDAWHELHDGNCETLRSDEALARAEAELNITPQSE